MARTAAPREPGCCRRGGRGGASPARGREGRAADVGEPAGDRPIGPEQRHGNRRPRRIACSAVTAPEATMLSGWARRSRTATTKASAASCWCTTANGGSARALNGTAGMRRKRPSGLGMCGPRIGRQAQCPDRDANPLGDAAPVCLDAGQHAAPIGRRLQGDVLVGPGHRPATAAVHLDAAPEDDRFERTAFRDRAEHGDHRVVGQAARRVGRGPGVRLPDREVDQHVGVEPGDLADDAVMLTSARYDGRPFAAASLAVGRCRYPRAIPPTARLRASWRSEIRVRRPFRL